MLVYIRHSEDTVEDPTHEHDPKLTKEGRSIAYEQGVQLLKKYGPPDIVYCSPFRRTRETLDYMFRDLSSRERARIKIIYDPRAARHFKHEEQDNPDVARITIKSNIPIYESRKSYRSRANRFALKLSQKAASGQEIWCITHTTVYKRLARIYEVKIPRIIPYMHYFVIHSNIESESSVESKQTWCDRCRTYH